MPTEAEKLTPQDIYAKIRTHMHQNKIKNLDQMADLMTIKTGVHFSMHILSHYRRSSSDCITESHIEALANFFDLPADTLKSNKTSKRKEVINLKTQKIQKPEGVRTRSDIANHIAQSFLSMPFATGQRHANQ
jgi:hypothetical protein